jgi:hypothetical protein
LPVPTTRRSKALSGTAVSPCKAGDAQFVACTDKAERDRVRDSFLKKKLALTGSDADLDNAVMEVCQKMKADRDKSRVAFYYLLAEKYGKLAAFH